MKVLKLISPTRPKELEMGPTKIFVRTEIQEAPVDTARTRVNYTYTETQYTHEEYLVAMLGGATIKDGAEEIRLSTLETKMGQVEPKIEAVEAKAKTNETAITELKAKDKTLEAKDTELEGKVTANESEIATLKEKDTELEGRVAALEA